MPDRGTLHVSQPLSNVAVEYKNGTAIWDKVLKPVPVAKETDTYYLFGQEFLRYYGKKRADGKTSTRVLSFSASTDTYTCLETSYNDVLTERMRNKCDAVINPEARMTNSLMKIVDLDIEVDAAATVFATGSYDSTMRSTPTKKWAPSEAEGDPIGNIDTARTAVQKQIGVKANTVVVGQEVHDNLKRHPDFMEYFKYTGSQILTEAQIKQVLEVENYIVGGMTYITSKQGQATVTKDFIWGKFCAVIYVPAASAIDEPAFGYTFLHQLFGTLTARVKKWREEGLDGDIIEAGRSYDQKVTGLLSGYLFSAVIS